MKCPKCGLEVVIATDMCPQCGYKYSFNSAASPGGASASERSGRARDEESERWTRAGVYTGSVRTEKSSRAGEGTRGMRWYGAVVNIILPITAVYYFYRGVSSLSNAFLMQPLGDFFWFYRLTPWLLAVQVVDTLVYIIFGIAALIAMKRLKSFDWRGVKLYLASIIVPVLVHMVCEVLWMTYFDFYAYAFSLTVEFVAAVAYVVVTSVYFSRRREMFHG